MTGQQTDMFQDQEDPRNRFHNTIDLEGQELEKQEAKTAKQDILILDVFCRHSSSKFTAFMVLDLLHMPEGKPKPPITSVRRAMTNLTKRGYLIKTDEQKDGNYGVKNYLYTLKQ